MKILSKYRALVSAFFCTLLLCTFCSATAVWAEDSLRLKNFLFDTEKENITLYYGIEIEPFDALKTLLREGNSLVLISNVAITPESSFFPTSDIIDLQKRALLTQDSLTREYVLSENNGSAPNRSKSLRKILAQWDNMRMPLCHSEELTKGNEYTLTLSIQLQFADISPWLSKTLFFWSWDVLPPVTLSLPFTF